MTAEARAGVSPAELSSLPACTLTASQLGDLELLLSGALAPLTGFMPVADAVAVADRWRLADGTPFPVPITLDVPASVLPTDAALDRILLSDPEGTPIAVLTVEERTALSDRAGMVRLAGPVSANRPPEHGPFRRLMLSPATARAELGDGPVLAFATRGPLSSRQIGQIRHLAGQLKARVLILPLVSGHAAVVGSPQALIRSVLAAMPSLPADSLLVPVPLPAHAEAPASQAGRARELAVTARVAAAYGATHLMADGTVPTADLPTADLPTADVPRADLPTADADRMADLPTAGADLAASLTTADVLPAGPDLRACARIPILPSGDWAYDRRAEVWRPHALIEAGTEWEDLSADQLGDLLDAGSEIPHWAVPAAVARELRRV
ncbi:MAG TPA: hypothetical protein VGH96_08070, partial [Streptosporangiaceae bacterium]